MGSKAHIIQWQYILYYPEFAIQSSCTYESKRKERLAKEKLHQLRDHLSSQKPVKTKCLLSPSQLEKHIILHIPPVVLT